MKHPQPIGARLSIPVLMPDMVINYQWLKRPFDLTISLLAFILALPLIGVIAILIKLTSQGPVFYTQERMGEGGKPFRLYKLRSMCEGAEKNGPELAKEGDPRITPLGRMLRKSRLDELPQLWNVIKGDMSLVGPRPERKYYIDLIVEQAPNYKRLLSIKPGLTSMG